MFEFLSELGHEISSRYQTVIRDIKAKSNSFYDAYLDLQEASIKAILEAHGFNYDESRTCGYLLRGEEVSNLFVNDLHVPKDTYDAIHNRTAKVNHHKHQKSKHILVDSVIAFMETFHKFMSICCGSSEEFDGEYFRSIFGEYERVNLALMQEKESIVSELEELAKEKRLNEEQLRTYAEALSMSKGMEEDLAEQNDALLHEISALKSLKLSVLDQKLNRTIDMLNDLQAYLVENRALSIAIGQTIIGSDVSESSYMVRARESMKSAETIQNLLSERKVTAESYEELCDIAKKFFDERKYVSARKIYAQIHKEMPFDWRSDFYMTVCDLEIAPYSKETYRSEYFPKCKDVCHKAIEQIGTIEEISEKNRAVIEVYNWVIITCDWFYSSATRSLIKVDSFIYDVQQYISFFRKALNDFTNLASFDDISKQLQEKFVKTVKATADRSCSSAISMEDYEMLMAGLSDIENMPYKPV